MRTFSSDEYIAEMRSLVARAIDAWRAQSGEPLYTASIWTDPDAGVSAVSFDTRSNSDAQVQAVNEYNRKMYERHVAEGDLEMAELFQEAATRNCNPADFAFREIVTCEHESLPNGWGESTDGECWDALLPALRNVAQWAQHEFSTLELAPGAELAINSSSDWYDETWLLGAA